MLALATKYAVYGVYALPLAIAGAWFLHFPAAVGLPLALVGIVSGVLLWIAKHPMSDPPAPSSKGGAGGGVPPKTK